MPLPETGWTAAECPAAGSTLSFFPRLPPTRGHLCGEDRGSEVRRPASAWTLNGRRKRGLVSRPGRPPQGPLPARSRTAGEGRACAGLPCRGSVARPHRCRKQAGRAALTPGFRSFFFLQGFTSCQHLEHHAFHCCPLLWAVVKLTSPGRSCPTPLPRPLPHTCPSEPWSAREWRQVLPHCPVGTSRTRLFSLCLCLLVLCVGGGELSGVTVPSVNGTD